MLTLGIPNVSLASPHAGDPDWSQLSFVSMTGERAQKPKIMWAEVISSGKRSPYSPSAHRLSRLRKLFRPR